MPGLVGMTRTQKYERVVWEKGRQSRSLEEARGRWVVLGGSPRDFLFTSIFSPILSQHLEPLFVSGVHIVRTK